jgi:hypothetical protein
MKKFYTKYFAEYTKLAFDEKNYVKINNFVSLAKDLGLRVVTFTGRNINNSLKSHGDINFWVVSDAIILSNAYI